MNRDESWQVIDDARAELVALFEQLTPTEWATPSLCGGWAVRDVAAHLAMAATMPIGEVMRAAARAGFNFDRMVHDTSVERGKRPTEQISADLRGVIGSRKLAPSTFWRDPLLDILVHGQDIVRPLGRYLAPRPDAAKVAAEWAWQRRFPFFPSRHLKGLRLVAEDVQWARGSGEELRGPVTSLLLISTGRSAGLADLHGPGLELAHLRQR